MIRPNRVRSFLNADRIAALLFLALIAWYGWESTGLTTALEVDVVGPGFFPRILTVIGLALGVLLLVGRSPGMNQQTESGPGGVRSDLVALVPVLLLLGYVLVLEPVGFPVATVGFLAITFRYLGYPAWKGALLLAAGITVVIFALFHFGLAVRLPLGVFAGLA